MDEDDVYALEEAEAVPSVKGWARLMPLSGGGAPLELVDAEHQYVVGRNAGSDLVLNCQVVSGAHCKVYKDKKARHCTFLMDTSTNGTFLGKDRERVGKGKQRILKNGEIIVFAKANTKINPPVEEDISYMFVDVEEDEKEQIIWKDYQQLQVLGTGAFAVVRLAAKIDNPSEMVAVKIISKKKCDCEALEREVAILQSIKHKHIIEILESRQTEDNLYLVLEYATGGELFDYIVDKGMLSEEESIPLIRQMLEALAYLHSRGIAHRDLKLENILMKDDTKTEVKISDFGLSRVVGEGSFMKTICGTPEYLAPEVLSEEAKTRGYDKAVDMWSMGVILYTMLFGRRPFEGDEQKSVLGKVKLGIFDFPKDTPYSEAAADFIRKCLTKDPSQRISAEDALKHTWLTRVGSKRALEDTETSLKKHKATEEEEE